MAEAAQTTAHPPAGAEAQERMQRKEQQQRQEAAPEQPPPQEQQAQQQQQAQAQQQQPLPAAAASKPPEPGAELKQMGGLIEGLGASVESVGKAGEGVWEGAERAAGAVGGAGERVWEGAEAGAATLEEAVAGVVGPVASWTYFLAVTLPWQLAVASVEAAWATMQRLASFAVRATRWAVVSSSVPITNASDTAYRYILHGLQQANKGMDVLLTGTPRLIRETLGSSAAAHIGEHPGAGGQVMPQETDLAREANRALHQAFEGSEKAEAQGTLLMEARLLVWHSWLLVGLQATALRSMLQVMEGMASWTARAWWQLMVCSALLSAMAVLAPLAAGAAGVAWTSHVVLTQVLSLRTYEESLRRVWAPPLHSTVAGVQGVLSPYLAVRQQPQLQEREQQEPSGPIPEGRAGGGAGGAAGAAVEAGAAEGAGEGAEGEGGGLLETAVGLVGQAYAASSARVGAGVDAAKRGVAGVLGAAEAATARLVPEAEKAEEGARAPLRGTEAELSAAAESADRAWVRASLLASAAAWTLLDAARVLVIATAQRFEFPLPEWVLAPSDKAQQISHDPAIGELNVAAGKGPDLEAMSKQQQQPQPHEAGQPLKEGKAPPQEQQKEGAGKGKQEERPQQQQGTQEQQQQQGKQGKQHEQQQPVQEGKVPPPEQQQPQKGGKEDGKQSMGGAMVEGAKQASKTAYHTVSGGGE